MTEHPIQGLMKTAMEQITEMVNVNTIVGDPIETPDGSVIMPISRVGFGFAAGGSEFNTDTDDMHRGVEARNAQVALPFGGGSGGGVSITPIAFLVVGKQGVKIVPLDNQTHLWERMIDAAPQVVDKIQSMMKGGSMGQSGMMSGGSIGQSGTGSSMGSNMGSNMSSGMGGGSSSGMGTTMGTSSNAGMSSSAMGGMGTQSTAAGLGLTASIPSVTSITSTPTSALAGAGTTAGSQAAGSASAAHSAGLTSSTLSGTSKSSSVSDSED